MIKPHNKVKGNYSQFTIDFSTRHNNYLSIDFSKLLFIRLLPLIRWVIGEHIAGVRHPILPNDHPDLAPPAAGRRGARAASGGRVGSGVGRGHHAILEIGVCPKMAPPSCPIASSSLVILLLQSTKFKILTLRVLM